MHRPVARGRPRPQPRTARNIQAWQLERVVVPETSILQATLAPHSLTCVPVPQNVCSQMPQGALNLQGGGVKVVTLGGSALGVVLL